MSALPHVKHMPRQLLLFTTIAFICLGITHLPAHSEEKGDSDRDGYPEKVVPGGTFLY